MEMPAKPHWAGYTLVFPALLALFLAARILLQVWLYRVGFISLTADEFSRTVIAARWAESPYLFWSGVWLPIQTYIYGIGLRLAYDLVATPRILTIVFGLASIVLMFLVSLELMENAAIALVSAILLGINPLHIWLSSTPLTEILHTALILACVWGFLRFWRTQALGYLCLSSALLALANGVRFEAWMVSLIFSVTLGFWWLKRLPSRQAQAPRAWHLLAAASLPWFFPLAWMVGSYRASGNPLDFMAAIRSYKLTFYGATHSYRNYLSALLRIDPFATVLFPLGAIAALWRSNSRRSGWYAALVVLPAAIFIGLHGGQTEPPGNYVRYMAPFLFLFYPFIAWLLVKAAGRLPARAAWQIAGLALSLVIIAFFQIRTAFHFVDDPAASGLAVGSYLKDLRLTQPASENLPALIEVSYWQYLAIQVGANDVDSILFDRKMGAQYRQAPSEIDANPQALKDCIAHFQIAYIIVKSASLTSFLQDRLGLSPGQKVNGYTFYAVPQGLRLDSSESERSCPLDFSASR